jgi:hypothetical protein
LKKTTKTVLTGILGVVLILVLAAFILLMNIRWEFTKYLDGKYSELSFTVGFTKIDPIYGKYYAMASCSDDNIVFPITKSFNTKHIQENYVQTKSQQQYNYRLNEIFRGSIIEGQIRSITGGGKTPFDKGSIYTQINIHLTEDAKHVLAAKEVMHMLQENNISAERIIFTYETDKHVYEIKLSSEDYSFNEEEIKDKVKMIK